MRKRGYPSCVGRLVNSENDSHRTPLQQHNELFDWGLKNGTARRIRIAMSDGPPRQINQQIKPHRLVLVGRWVVSTSRLGEIQARDRLDVKPVCRIFPVIGPCRAFASFAAPTGFNAANTHIYVPNFQRGAQAPTAPVGLCIFRGQEPSNL
jgi:hypothetical protein